MVVARTEVLRRSTRRLSMKTCKAALEAQYAALPGMPRKAARLETATRCPASRAIIAGSAAERVTHAALTFTSRVLFTAVQSILRALPGEPTPALAMTR